MISLVKTFVFALLIGIIFISSHQNSAQASGLYVSGVMGAATEIKSDARKKSSFALTVGYALPVLVKTELTYRQLGNTPHLSAGARLTVLPFLNVNGGLVHRMAHAGKTTGAGYYGGLGVNFWLIPVIDIIADVNYLSVGSDHHAIAEAGIRFHF